MKQHLSLDLELAPETQPRTVADLCRRIKGTSGLPTTASITFTLTRGKLRAVGVEVEV